MPLPGAAKRRSAPEGGKAEHDAMGEVAARKSKSGAALRVTASGDASGFTAGVSLFIVF